MLTDSMSFYPFGMGTSALPFGINSRDEEELLSLPDEIQQILLRRGGDSEKELHQELSDLELKK